MIAGSAWVSGVLHFSPQSLGIGGGSEAKVVSAFAAVQAYQSAWPRIQAGDSASETSKYLRRLALLRSFLWTAIFTMASAW
jgi:hypothetical protein